MAMVMVAVVVLTWRAAPSEVEIPAQLTLAATAPSPIWVEVAEFIDPQPKRSLVVVDRRPPRFVTLVPNEHLPWAPIPEPNSPATV
jgi:hypothetical protein